MKPITVLSLFDGISCGLVALKRAGIPVKTYYASEIDKYAIKISEKNHPEIIRLGDVENWREWDIETPDLIIGGSPCQGFSVAGKGLNFDDPRSKLFFVFVDIVNHFKALNPDLLFLLENVKMKKEWRDVITDQMGVESVEINSSLVSAQNRKRLYWANWSFPQPEDRGIVLRDILESSDVDRDKSYVVDANYHKRGNPKRYFGKSSRQLVKLSGKYKISPLSGKSPTLSASSSRAAGGNGATLVGIKGAALRNQVTKRGTEAQLNIRKDDKSNAVVPSYPAKLNGLVQIGSINKGRQGERIYSTQGKSVALSSNGGGKGSRTGLYQVGEAEDIKGHDYNKRIYSQDGKSPSLASMSGGNLEPKVDAQDGVHYRKLTVVECERLQTLEDGYTEGVSNTQRYKSLGNGWTVEVIVHILKHSKFYTGVK